MKLSIIIPAFNEQLRIENTIRRITAFYIRQKIDFEIIVVDDGSTDDTSFRIMTLRRKFKNLRLISYKINKGKGAAVKAGVLKSKGEFILFTDADLSTPLSEFIKLWSFTNRGYDLIIASRGAKGSKILKRQGKIREYFGQFFGILTKTLVLRGVNDPQCGFKLFKAKIGKKAFEKVNTNGVLFDIEFLISAYKLGAKIKEVPVVWNHNSDSRIKYNLASSVNVFKELLDIKYRFKILTPVTIL